jgi:virginiamycin B lyase
LCISVFLISSNALALTNVSKGTYLQINGYSTPTPASGPGGITSGPDGALWFTEYAAGKIGRITVSGTVAEFPLPTMVNATPNQITAGPDGALWFTETFANKIGRITTSGQVAEFTIPTATALPVGIAAGSDGAIWFTEGNVSQIGRIDLAGNVTEFPTPGGGPIQIVAGPDGALWFTVENANIGRITTAGSVTEYPVPTRNLDLGFITVGPDGALWFTELASALGLGKIGRITTSGSISEYGGGLGLMPGSITSGPDGAIWFVQFQNAPSSVLARLTTTGTLTLFSGAIEPGGLTVGPDKAIWFTGSDNNPKNLGRAPACGLGLGLSFTNNTLDVNFDLGSSVPTTFDLWYDTATGFKRAFSKPLGPVAPPARFSVPVAFPANARTVRIESALADSSDKFLCAEQEQAEVR